MGRLAENPAAGRLDCPHSVEPDGQTSDSVGDDQGSGLRAGLRYRPGGGGARHIDDDGRTLIKPPACDRERIVRPKSIRIGRTDIGRPSGNAPVS